jgi:3-phosphoshikimate 1-carboxyvinyltransferase
MVAPYAGRPVELEVVGALVSQPYVLMTLKVMEAFGVTVRRDDLSRIQLPRASYRGCQYDIEPDASAASYFFAAAAITRGEVTVEGLSQNSLQGDVEFVRVLERMGCNVRFDARGITIAGQPLSGIDVNMNAISDTVQTLAAVALFASGPTTIRGVGHIRHKETDRIGALATELRKLGAKVDELDDGLRIEPRPLTGAQIETYDDHRMAMSLALVGLVVPGVVILNPGCTSKTYPAYFADLQSLTPGR